VGRRCGSSWTDSQLLAAARHPIPTVATADIARVASQLLQDTWTGIRVIELEGPQRYTADDIAIR